MAEVQHPHPGQRLVYLASCGHQWAKLCGFCGDLGVMLAYFRRAESESLALAVDLHEPRCHLGLCTGGDLYRHKR